MRRKLRRIVTVVTIATAALLVAVIATLSSLDYNAYRDTIAAEIERATGREVKIDGELKLDIGLSPSLSVTGVSFANVAGGSRPQMAKLDRLEAKVALWPLLSGDIDVDRLVVIGADILLETNEAGVGNWVFSSTSEAGAKAQEKVAIPLVGEVVVERSVLTYMDGKRRHQVRVDSLTAKLGGGETPLKLSFSGAVDGTSLSLGGAVGSLKRLRDDHAYPLDVELAIAGMTLGVEGTIGRPLQGRGLDLAISGKVPDLAGLSKLAGTALPKLGPIDATLMLSDKDGSYQLDNLKMRVAGSDLTGHLNLTVGTPPRLVGALHSDKLAIADLVPPVSGPEKDDGRIFPADPLPISGLDRLAADLTYQATQVLIGRVALRDVEARIRLGRGMLSVKPAAATLADGKLDFAAGLDTAKSPPRLSFDFDLREADLGQLSKDAADSDLLRGTLDLKLHGAGGGASVREIMAGLNGRANAVVVDGYIAKGYVDLLAADLLSSLVPGERDIEGSKVNCFIADFPVAKGLAATRVLLLDTERMTVTGEGAIDLASERIKLQLKPKPKDPSLLSLATPVNVGGTLADPTVAPDTVGLATGAAGAVIGNLVLPGAGLLLPLLSPGSDDKHPCLRAIGGKAPPSSADKNSGGIGGFLKGLGDKIDKTLGTGK